MGRGEWGGWHGLWLLHLTGEVSSAMLKEMAFQLCGYSDTLKDVPNMQKLMKLSR